MLKCITWSANADITNPNVCNDLNNKVEMNKKLPMTTLNLCNIIPMYKRIFFTDKLSLLVNIAPFS